MLIILKVIGIALLILVLLMLALLMLILCTPLRYRVWGGYHNEKPDVEARFGIWFSALAAYVRFKDEGLTVYLKIFGVRKCLIGQSPEIKKTESAEEAAETKKTEAAIERKAEDMVPSEAADERDTQNEYNVSDAGAIRGASVSDAGAIREASVSDDTVSDLGTRAEERQRTALPETEKPSVSKSLSRLMDKVRGIYNKLQELIKGLQKLYRSIKRKEKAVMCFLDEPSTKHMIALLKKQFMKILKGILPKKLTGELRLGFEDPAVMGRICMFGGMFYPMYEKHFSFTPVFGEKAIEGEGFFRGRIILGAILAHVVRILIVPDFYRCLKNAKKLMIRLK